MNVSFGTQADLDRESCQVVKCGFKDGEFWRLLLSPVSKAKTVHTYRYGRCGLPDWRISEGWTRALLTSVWTVTGSRNTSCHLC